MSKLPGLRVALLLFALSYHEKLPTAKSEDSQKEHTASKETLRLVQIIIRHGARAPIGRFPNDPYKNQTLYWPEGWSELTQVGFHQHLELGKYLRKRYDGFLPQKYSKFDFQCDSSDVDRAIQSAEANVAELYKSPPIVTESEFLEPVWQYVPIHTITFSSDTLFNNKGNCPRYLTLLRDVYSLTVQQHSKQNAEFLHFVAENGGFDDKDDFGNSMKVQDSLLAEKIHNLTLPDWATGEVVARLDHLKALSFEWEIQTEEMKRLRAGPMIQMLIKNFKIKANTSEDLSPDDSTFQYLEPFRKMRLFSAHDWTITNLLVPWGIYDWNIPPFASAVMIELHKKPSHPDFIVEVYYRNDTTKIPYLLEMKDCGTPCYLSKLEEFSSQFIPTDWESECQVNSSVPILSKDANTFTPEEFNQLFQGGWSITTTLMVLVLAGTMIAATVFVSKRKRTRTSINQDPSLKTSYETFHSESL